MTSCVLFGTVDKVLSSSCDGRVNKKGVVLWECIVWIRTEPWNCYTHNKTLTVSGQDLLFIARLPLTNLVNKMRKKAALSWHGHVPALGDPLGSGGLLDKVQ